MVSAETLSLTTGLRGLAYWEIEVEGPNRDLHSGHFGGAVANPINVLCKMIAGITDENGRITIPGFYDDVEELSKEEREMIAQIPFDEAKYKEAIGVKAVFGEKDIQHWNATVADPLSMFAEYGAVISEKAAKQSCRPRRMQKYPADWFLTRIMKRYPRCLKHISIK